jgi:DNA transformation protein
MSVDAGLIDRVGEAMAPVGSVTSRAMMGGATLYLDGTVFAIVATDLLWFKADKTTDAYWDALDAGRFSYERDGVATMNYRQARRRVRRCGRAPRPRAGGDRSRTACTEEAEEGLTSFRSL